MATDRTARKFDQWARNGKAEEMESGHARSVSRMLDSAAFARASAGRFTFLDVGCGNGWVVRTVAGRPGCVRSVGIDKSREMIRSAKRNPQNTGKEEYFCADVDGWRYRGRGFDCALAMESIYYAESTESALRSICGLLGRGGVFLCGTDFYAENAATRRWAASMGITMHLYSKDEWRALFMGAGFEVRLRQIKNPDAKQAWKRNAGTLLITGTKPA